MSSSAGPPAPGSVSAAMRPPSITTSAANTAESVATVPPPITVRLPLTATAHASEPRS